MAAYYSVKKGKFIISGPDVKIGTTIKHARLVDEASTIMSIFGLDMPEDIDGKIIKEILLN